MEREADAAWADDEAAGMENHARMVSDERARQISTRRAVILRRLARYAREKADG